MTDREKSIPSARDVDEQGHCSRCGGTHYGTGLVCVYSPEYKPAPPWPKDCEMGQAASPVDSQHDDLAECDCGTGESFDFRVHSTVCAFRMDMLRQVSGPVDSQPVAELITIREPGKTTEFACLYVDEQGKYRAPEGVTVISREFLYLRPVPVDSGSQRETRDVREFWDKYCLTESSETADWPLGERMLRFAEVYATHRLAASEPVGELLGLLKRAQEELRLIRMKDCDAVYDTTLRFEIDLAEAKYGKGNQQ